MLIKLVAKGRDVSELFAAVVKNVAAKNLEVYFLSVILLFVLLLALISVCDVTALFK